MQKIILVSFADSRYRNALARLENYTRDFPFTERHFHTEKNTFTREYWHNLKPWLYRRGYGYWEWKGHLVRHYLGRMETDDILVWSDAGVYWNNTPKAKYRFKEYCNLLGGDKNILAFQEPYIEQEWSKGDLLVALKAYNDDEICLSKQLWTGCFFIKKVPETVNLIDKWASINERRHELETDKRSKVPNKKGFKEHRHDQSSFSVLVKNIPHIEISHTETQPVVKGDWESMKDFPIQARRHKEKLRPIPVIIKNKLLRPWRMFLNFYFRKIRDYDYLTRSYPW